MLKSVHMVSSAKHKINLNIAILLIIVCMILLCTRCHQSPQFVCQACQPIEPASGSAGACIDVEGKVWVALNHAQKYIFIKPQF
jgi:hypothetical protein